MGWGLLSGDIPEAGQKPVYKQPGGDIPARGRGDVRAGEFQKVQETIPVGRREVGVGDVCHLPLGKHSGLDLFRLQHDTPGVSRILLDAFITGENFIARTFKGLEKIAVMEQKNTGYIVGTVFARAIRRSPSRSIRPGLPITELT